jgi:hypothetical protein
MLATQQLVTISRRLVLQLAAILAVQLALHLMPQQQQQQQQRVLGSTVCLVLLLITRR